MEPQSNQRIFLSFDGSDDDPATPKSFAKKTFDFKKKGSNSIKNDSQSKKSQFYVNNFIKESDKQSKTSKASVNIMKSPSFKVEQGFREALRKVDTKKDDKMVELISIVDVPDDSKSSKYNSNFISVCVEGNDIINYTEGNRSEYFSNASEEIKESEGENSYNIKVIKKESEELPMSPKEVLNQIQLDTKDIKLEYKASSKQTSNRFRRSQNKN